MKFKKIGILAVSLMSVGLITTGCSSEDNNNSIIQGIQDFFNQKDVKETVRKKVTETIDKYNDKSEHKNIASDGDFKTTYDELSKLDFNSGDNIVYTVNNNESTLNIADWAGPKIEYSDLDELNRTQTALAHLSKENYGKSEGRSGQRWNPTGWNNQAKKINGKKTDVHNRGHLIAYTITFNLDNNGKPSKGEAGSIDNPKNLFTQSAYSNQVTFQKYEGIVRDSIKAGHKVLYRVQPVFRNDEKMARGLWAQAVSDDGKVNFNVYIFNVQPNISYDYSTGKSSVDKNMIVND